MYVTEIRYSLVFKDMNGDESNVSAKEFVDILKQNPDYKGGNIRLIACEVGAGEGIRTTIYRK